MPYVIATRGGVYAGTEGDSQTPYLRQFLEFLGIHDVTFVYAEGLSAGDDTARAEARDAIGLHLARAVTASGPGLGIQG
jgi:FMN-dependent NADH-azoreductase